MKFYFHVNIETINYKINFLYLIFNHNILFENIHTVSEFVKFNIFNIKQCVFVSDLILELLGLIKLELCSTIYMKIQYLTQNFLLELDSTKPV